MNPLRSLIAFAGAAALLALAACGGGGSSDAADATDGAPSAVQVDTSRTARATLGPAGGSVSATAVDGRVYTLTVPAGALATDTEITATPVTSMGDAPLAAGVKGAVRFGPAGLKFGQVATLRIEGAATSAAAGKRLVGFVRSDDGAAMQLVPVEVAGNALELPVPHFSDGGAAEATREELAAIPLAPITDPVQELWDTLNREIQVGGTEADDIAVVVRLHDQQVAPLLQSAEAQADDVTQDPVRESAVATWAAWQRIVDISGLAADKFGDRVPQARARAGALLLAQVDRGRTACLAPPPLDIPHLRGLWRALWAQKVAQLHRLDAADLGLDADTVARRMNDCARVAFVPRPLPTFEAGRPVSLDAQAELIFAADANVEAPIDFEFTLSSSDAAIANPQGFADLQRRYTTVVTPSAAEPVFDVRACLVTYMANGAPVPSVMCARESLGGAPQVVLAGTIKLFADVSTPGGGLVQTGSVALRLRADGNGFTVTLAQGSYGYVRERSSACTEDGGATREITLRTSESGIVSGGREAFPTLELNTTSTVRSERFTSGCAVVAEVANFSNPITLVMTNIQRDAQNRPVSMELLLRGQVAGRLVRE